ncbi:hypothetical protein AM493_15690 [Flavobacterium akiainvivens]|uniref:DUF7674 domain-containing protein n=1 Tax=Flavobacterium akiainvivens TaxID=1202724 RepID=A0A0M8MKD4_9FLAO|nr:hypothetical protein [Flavobacterium akiainvivens]KOS07318.1 hypothetical protein AM493_15690 [Flavobacterium akiainvivens]SFQ46623.1 hypothetical protein SAMN05444144_105120 [Flavobacterium akiainvivens]
MRHHVKTAAIKAVQFAEITKACIRQGHITRAKKCLDIAELLFTTGSNETKNAIGNIYVYSVSTFMEVRNCTVAKLFPPQLKREYVSQINASGV